MSYLPVLRGIPHNKFANPLSGLVYDNRKYAESCYQSENIEPILPHTHSHNSKIIQSTFFKEEVSRSITLNRNQVTSQKEFRSTKIINLSKRLSNPNKFRCTRNKWMSEKEISTVQLKSTKGFSQSIEKSRRVQSKVFKFPQIKALIIDLYHSAADNNKICILNLKKYFEMFFKDSLSGIISTQLIEIVQKYAENCLQEPNNQEKADFGDDDNDYINIITKQHLCSKLKQLQQLGKKEEILKIIRIYCLPSVQIRRVFMQDLLDLISIQLYQNFNCSKSNYALLKENGQIINDFAQIRFSTTRLFITSKANPKQSYQRYIQTIQNNNRLKNRFHFREHLKVNFREKVAKGNYDNAESPIKSIREEINEKKRNLNLAQGIIDIKNQKNFISKVNNHFTADCSIRYSCSKSKEKLQSPKIMQTEGYNKTIDSKIEKQFRILKNKNNFINTILKNDEESRDKIQIQILVNQCVYFKNKTQAQIQKIMSALLFIEKQQKPYSYGKSLINYNQYLMMRKIIDCVAEKQEMVKFIDNYLNFDEYGELEKSDFHQILAFIVGSESKTADVILNTIWNWMQKNGVITRLRIRKTDMQLIYEKNKLVYYFLISLIFGTNQVSVLALTQDILE